MAALLFQYAAYLEMSDRQPLRILLLPSWYPTSRYPMGGIFCREQARALASMEGVEVLVLFIDRVPPRLWLRGKKRRASLRVEAGVRVYRTQMPRLPGVWPLLYVVWAVLSVRRLASRYGYKPDVLHAHVTLPAGLAGAFLRRISGLPLIITEHTSPFSILMRNWFARLTTRGAIWTADRVIAVSQALRDEIWAHPQLRRAIDIIPNVVDVGAFSRERTSHEPPFRLLFVGEMETRRKGVEYLLHAVSLLRERGVAVCLDIAGGGQNLGEYKALAAELKLSDVCHFHGVVSHSDVARLMSQADLFMLPSLAETFGVVLVEAMAAGLPVVATRCGGPEEVVTPDVGILVEPANSAALADAIEDILGRLDTFDPEYLRHVAEERYGQASVGARLVDLYREVIGR